jgi:hypothetical protein
VKTNFFGDFDEYINIFKYSRTQLIVIDLLIGYLMGKSARINIKLFMKEKKTYLDTQWNRKKCWFRVCG